MHADSVFFIGSSHQVCEDYASHALDCYGNPIAALSDGCSGGERCDIGARIMVQQIIRKHIRPTSSYRTPLYLGMSELPKIYKACQELGFEFENLLATLLFTEIVNNEVHARVRGDGFIFARRRDTHQWIVIQVEYETNAPYYPIYRLKPQYSVTYPITTVWEVSEDLVKTNVIIRSEEYPLGANLEGFNVYNSLLSHTFADFQVDQFDIVLVGSDGWDSWVKDGNTKHDPENNWILMFREFMNIKSAKGAFLKRTMKRVIRVAKENGLSNYDDISVAGVYTG